MSEELAIVQELLALVQAKQQETANLARFLDQSLPKGTMLPCFGETLPENRAWVWADGQTNWPHEDWVPAHLRGSPVPDMRQRLVGGTLSPGDNTVGTEWSGGVIPIPGTTVKGASFKLQPAAPVRKPVDANGIQALRLRGVDDDGVGDGANVDPNPDLGWPVQLNLTSGRMTGTVRRVLPWDPHAGHTATYSLPSLGEATYADTTYPETLAGEQQIEERKVELKDASTNPRHLRANWIIRVK